MVLVVVANEFDICLRVEIFCDVSAVHGSSSKIAAEYYGDSRGSRFEFAVDGSSNDGDD